MPRGKTAASFALINACRRILEEVHPATIRAVCYRLFVAGLLESMAKKCTNRVSTQLVYAREQHLIPWSWVVDETREPERIPAWDDPADFVKTVKRAYRRDRWAHQPHRVEVWSEKGTVRGTLAPVLEAYGVTFRVMHGYASATVLYDVAQESRRDRRPFIVLYAGDWDPSGLHMREVDLPQRLADYGAAIAIRRIALTEADVTAGELPAFAAETKQGDPRHRWFVERYGERCWELDALNPRAFRRRIEETLLTLIDADRWARCGLAEAAECDSLQTILGNWQTAISRQASP
jgi:hypothetical protein